eukprot:CAMPEP_0184661522 /NCGR_PEP_ID=MMETSP0308-20130426/38854_1 /TAXON_ID=38269 /ORGANISM="Gloeochaete witrockiana, Strain SAG 46.84" /LENGTH=110 /DNA_ID=CAMNT_0027102887 /DNA_START=115 /DNA_END=447 /DNA_ORIENTATION=+
MPPLKNDSRALIHKLRTQIRQHATFNSDRAKFIGKKKLSDLPKAQLIKIAQDIGIDTKGYEGPLPSSPVPRPSLKERDHRAENLPKRARLSSSSESSIQQEGAGSSALDE